MERKDNNFQGDLSDIIRASYGSTVGTSSSESASYSHDDLHWMFVSDPMMMTMDFSSVLEQDHSRGGFGDPFSNMSDPFLQDQLGMPSAGSASYYCFNNNSSLSGSAEISGGALKDAVCFGDAVVVGSIDNNNSCVLARGNVVEDDTMMMMMRRAPPCNNNIILSNMIQISPKAKLPISSSTCVDSPKIVKASSAVLSLAGNMINSSTSKNKDNGLLMEQKSGGAGVQISSRNNPAAGLKRRKSQAKKSICIPAPTAPNSRQSGEVVPSDLWAWRKYGQKPIKGSPYPRGYYRCSSSKGCPARKQVERSRTDPNMLVITYTCEHNHPWPTQKNSLAGSSRSQPSKKNIINSASQNYSSVETTHEPHKGTTTTLPQEEEQESNISTDNSANNNSNASVKLEEIDHDGMMEKQQLEMDDDDGGFSNGSSVAPYKNNKQLLEDLFAKLGEMEAADEYDDSMMKGLINNAVDHDDDPQQIRESKGLDPFHVFDWSGDNSTRYHLI